MSLRAIKYDENRAEAGNIARGRFFAGLGKRSSPAPAGVPARQAEGLRHGTKRALQRPNETCGVPVSL
jgi:hypothetical protein